MRTEQIERCDGCGNRISPGVERWETEVGRDADTVTVRVTHPNPRCARAAEEPDRKGRPHG